MLFDELRKSWKADEHLWSAAAASEASRLNRTAFSSEAVRNRGPVAKRQSQMTVCRLQPLCFATAPAAVFRQLPVRVYTL
jgi:hypothetical protein